MVTAFGAKGTGTNDPADLVQDDRVHRLVYTDAEIFALEMERIFERTWVFIGHVSEIPSHGDYRTRWIGRQPVIFIRHSDGAPQVLMNRCMHRGATLCNLDAGNAPALECIYHGWRYDTDGKLDYVSYRDGYDDSFDTDAMALMRPALVDSHRGFVFASLNPDVPPLKDHLGKAGELLDSIVDTAPDGEIDVDAGTMKYKFDGNWKLQIENWTDNYHPNFTHQTAFLSREGSLLRYPKMMALGALPNGHGYADYSEIRQKIDPNRPGYDDYLVSMNAAYGENRAAEIIGKDVQLLIFPNLFFQPSNSHFRIVQPVAPDRTEVYIFPYSLRGAPSPLNEAAVRSVSWWASAGGFGQPDDMVLLERCQTGYQVRGAEWCLISRGMHREEDRGGGEIVGELTDEVSQRGIFREWKRLMANAAAV